MVLETVPTVCVKLKEAPKPEPELFDISKPIGADSEIFVVKLLPDTVKLCTMEVVLTCTLPKSGSELRRNCN